MMMLISRVGAVVLTLCAAMPASAGPAVAGAASRWYTPSEVAAGSRIYAAQCASCHGPQAEGQPGWQKKGPAGFPAPPLTAAGHASHHSLDHLLNKLETGSAPGEGVMPSFRTLLSDDEKRAVLAWVQSLWPDAVYAAWSAQGQPHAHSH